MNADRLNESAVQDFNFVAEAPSCWARELRRIREKGGVRVRTPVLWGEHESLRGVRDFSRSPRLRIERFLTLAQEEGLRVEIVVSLALSEKGFPRWTLEQSQRALVVPPAEPAAHSLSLLSAPSLFDPDLLDGFLDFLRDLESVVSLYRFPEGPVDKVGLDLSAYATDQNAVLCEDFVSFLQMKYQKIANLNRRYQTSFNDFSSVLTERGMRVLLDRRPWLAAYDYAWCRHSLFEEFLDSFRRHKIVGKLFGSEIRGLLPESGPGAASLDIAMDSVLLEFRSPRGIFPLSPSGVASPSAAAAARVWEHLQFRASNSGLGFGALPLWQESDKGLRSPCVVICGRYLSRTSFRSLLRFVEGGGQIIFPFGLPKYDENLNYHNWSLGVDRKIMRCGVTELDRYRCGNGVIWSAIRPLEPDAQLWNHLCRLREGVQTVERESADGGGERK